MFAQCSCFSPMLSRPCEPIPQEWVLPRSCFLSAVHCCRLLLDAVLLVWGGGGERGNEKGFSVVGPVVFLGLCAGDMEFLLLE